MPTNDQYMPMYTDGHHCDACPAKDICIKLNQLHDLSPLAAHYVDHMLITNQLHPDDFLSRPNPTKEQLAEVGFSTSIN